MSVHRLRDLLRRRAQDPLDGRVYVKGGWVDRVSSVPTDAGVEVLVAWANTVWRKNIALNRQVLQLQDEVKQLRTAGVRSDAATL